MTQTDARPASGGSADLDPECDLVLEREVPVPVELVWAAWTQPVHLMKWFCPLPWQVTECQIDLRPGGRFRTLMRGPDGTEVDHRFCYLEVVPMKRLVWTDALEAGYRPNQRPGPLPFRFTGVLTMESSAKGTRYKAVAMHADPASARKHDEIGFSEGWGIATDQMVGAILKGEIR
jgi:uncharacterized protein YndB with AHSA1/START domain